MKGFVKPDYTDMNIINLMSSISDCHGQTHLYPQLSILKSDKLKAYSNLVLIVIDGLGYNFLKEQSCSFLKDNLHGRLTTTFLSTTACANTAFSLGYPAQQVGLPAWDVLLKEVGAVTTVLPFRARFGGDCLSQSGFDFSDLISIESFHKNFQAECYTVIDKKISESPFTKFISRDSTILAYQEIEQTFDIMQKILKKKTQNRKFIHTYIPHFDTVAHENGVGSKTARLIFSRIEDAVFKFVQNINLEDTFAVLTSDHGFVDIEQSNELWIESFPDFKDCLTTPLSGEARVRDCFVRPSKVHQFEKTVEDFLSEYCWCFKGQDLIKNNYYGLGQPCKSLTDRVGDYVLIMKDKYVLKDKLANHKITYRFLKGVHAGVSEDEMYVPLVVFED